jgi:hypothetical protein
LYGRIRNKKYPGIDATRNIGRREQLSVDSLVLSRGKTNEGTKTKTTKNKEKQRPADAGSAWTGKIEPD